MSLATNLRLTASAVEAQGEALERLVFCVNAYLSAKAGTIQLGEGTALSQLAEAVKFAQKFT